MSDYYKNTNSIDYTDRLGAIKMPEGYRLLLLDSGHFMWIHEEKGTESVIHWNKWPVYRGAVQDSKDRNK